MMKNSSGGAALLIMGAILTGLLVPVLKLILDTMNFRKQKLFENQLARQNSVVESQIKFLDHISELLWEFHALIARVSYYRKMGIKDKENRKRYTEALADYENKLWDILIVQIKSEMSKSRRLISHTTSQKLLKLYNDTLVGLDKELVQLLKNDSSQEDWAKFHDEKLKESLVREIDETLLLLAEDMGLTKFPPKSLF
jgi:hypothetical protein